MRALAPAFHAYKWAPPTDEVARLAGSTRRRCCGSTRTRRRTRSPRHGRRPFAGALARVSGYPAGGYRALRRAIADYAGVEPENVVLGAGADDLILLVRSRLRRPGRHGRDPRGADLSALPHRRRARRRRRRRRRSGAHVRLPAEQPDRRARPAARRAPARRRRGVLRVQRRDRAAAARRRRDRAAHVLQALRACRRARRLRARVDGGRRRAERAAGAGARLDALGRTRGRRARGPPGRAAGARGAGALRGGTARARLRAAGVARELPLRPDGRRPTRSSTALLQQGIVVRSFPGAFRVSVLDREDDDRCSRRSAALDRPSRRRAQRAHGSRDRRDALRDAARARRRSGAFASRPAPASTTTFSSSSRSMRASTSCSRAPATWRRATTTPPKMRRSRSARRSTPRSATGAGSRATAMPSCRWTTRSRGRRSTSAAGRSRSCSSSAIRGMAVHMFTSLAQAARATIHVEAIGPRRAPCRRSCVQGCRPRACVAVAPAGTGIPSTKGIL